MALGVLFLCNPIVEFYDVLPDLFGYILLCLGLWRLSDLSDELADAMRGFRNLIWVSIGQLAAQWIIHDFLPAFQGQVEGTVNEVNQYESPMLVLLVTFSWVILTWYFLLPAMRHLFAGFGALSMRAEHCAIGQERRGRALWERMARSSAWFAILLPLLALLPETAILTTLDLLSSEPTVTFDWYRFITLFRTVAGFAAGLVGVIWAILFVRFTIKIVRDRGFCDYLQIRYEREVLPRTKWLTYRRASVAFSIITAGLLFSADVRIDGHPLLHRAIAVLLLFVGIVWLTRPKLLSMLILGGCGVVCAVVGHLRWVYLNDYLTDHAIEEALYIPRAYEKFFVVRCLEVAQSVTFAIFFTVFLFCLWRALCRLDAEMDGAIFGKDRRQYLTKAFFAVGFSFAMAGFGIADAILQSDVRFLWWLTLCSCVAMLFAMRSLIMDCKDELFSCAREEEMNKIEQDATY